ncbi:MAG: hypothetical protein Q9222_006078 [Ikaeria aurantiellina]
MANVQVFRLFSLPPELIAHLINCLPKSELKRLRLVCRVLDEIACQYLFDRFVIAWDQENLKVAEEFFARSNLSRHCKKLVLDVQEFPSLNEYRYTETLIRQLANDFRARKVDRNAHPIPKPLRTRLDNLKWFEDPGTLRGRDKLLQGFRKRFTKGYRLYLEKRYQQGIYVKYHWTQQLWCRFLAEIFRKCPSLCRVEIQTFWEPYPQLIGDSVDSLLPTYPSSGMVARKWHPFYVRPRAPAFVEHVCGPLVSDLFTALHEVGHRLSHLELGYGCVATTDMSVYNNVNTRILIAESVVQNLTSLTLHLLHRSAFPAQLEPPEDNLLPALEAAQKLRYLKLWLSGGKAYREYDPRRPDLRPGLLICVFPRLMHLDLAGFSVAMDDLSVFLRRQKALRTLALVAIDLQAEDGHDETGSFSQLAIPPGSFPFLTTVSLKAPFRLCDDGTVLRVFSDFEWAVIKDEFQRCVCQVDH